MSEAILQVQNITKRFPGVVALNDVSFEVKKGEIHALVGENGAGKSTLMNILSGVYPPTEGQVLFEGKKCKFNEPLDAQKGGIAMIHQELSLAQYMTAAENVFIGRMPKGKLGLIDKKKMESETQSYFDSLGVSYIKPGELVKNLSVSEQQLVEIAKAISLNSRLLIMDEPTSSLTNAEIELLHKIMRDLKAKGMTIIYISHKLEEIMTIADAITVFRDGQHINTEPRSEYTEQRMINLMVGREFVAAERAKYMTDYEGQTPILSVKNISDKEGRVKDVSFDLYKGEVLGLTGLVGAGRSELLECIFGARIRTGGTIMINGEQVNIKDTGDAIDYGMGLVAEGRKIQGLFLKMSVEDNMTAVYLRNLSNKLGLINDKKRKGVCDNYVDMLSIKTPSLQQCINNLSGGNQQKCIIARWLMNSPIMLFLDEPTHGIDIGAKTEIYKIIDDLAAQGVSVILLSSELPEVLSLCDRIMVMHHGELRGILTHEEADQVKIMSFTLESAAQVKNKKKEATA